MSTPIEELKKKFARVPNEKLRKLHADSGMSTNELAKAIGIKHYDIMRAEFGRAIPVTNAIKIAKFFGTTVESLWDDK